MSEIKIVAARLAIKMFVDCPNPKCEAFIDLLEEDDTDGTAHNDDEYLLQQMFPSRGDHSDFECNDVTCTQCKTIFNVRGLEW